MDLRNVETYLRVAELKSFTKAAKELNFAQSTVTMQIQQLEKELGYRLFDRIGKTVDLTQPGEAFLQHAYTLLRTFENAKNLDQDPAKLGGTLRVGVLESLLFGTMLELLPRFREAFPNAELQLKMGQTTELVQQLKENRLDLVYLSADLNTDDELQCCYRRREELVFVCSPKDPSEGQSLWEREFVVTERSGVCYGRLLALAAKEDAVLRTCVEVDSTVAIIDAVQRGLGLGFLPQYAVQKQLATGTLVKLEKNCPPQYYYSQILCHKRHWMSPLMEGMIQIITENRQPSA